MYAVFVGKKVSKILVCCGKIKGSDNLQAQVVQRLDNAIHRINRYLVEKC